MAFRPRFLIPLLALSAALSVALLAAPSIARAESLGWATNPLAFNGPLDINDYPNADIEVAAGFNAVSLAGSQTGLAVGVRVDGFPTGTTKPLVVRSSNGGQTWSEQSLVGFDTVELNGVFAFSSTDAWVVGSGGTIAHWNGMSWTSRTVAGWALAKDFRAVVFTDALHGWAVGDGLGVAMTGDGGATWSIVTAPGVGATLRGIAAVDASTAIAVGDGGVMRLLNGSAAMAKSSGTGSNLYGVTFADALHGWAVGDNNTFVTTGNGGADWSARIVVIPPTAGLSPATLHLRSVAFSGPFDGMAVGSYQSVWRTADGGANWKFDRIHDGGLDDYQLSGVAFAGSATAPVAVGRRPQLDSSNYKARAYRGSWILPLNYTVTPTPSSHGTMSSAQTVPEGASAAFTVTPDTGYHVVRVFLDSSSTDLVGSGGVYTVANVTSDHTISAVFAIDTYQLHYGAGAGGILSGTASQTVTYGGGSTVTAIPNTGYHFVVWSDGIGTAARTDTGIHGPLTVSAVFAVDTFQLHYSAAAHGSLSGTASQTVDYGAGGSAVTAVADAGYHFVRWSDGVTTAGRTDLVVHGPITVSATFAIDTFQLHYSAGAGGTLSGTASQTVAYGGSGSSVTAEHGLNHHFVGWSDGSPVGATRTDLDVTRDITVTAIFAEDAPGSFTLSYSAGVGGTVSPAGPQTVISGSSGTAVTANPNPNYHFVAWSDGLTTRTRTDHNAIADKSFSAIFALDTYRLHYIAGAGGSISGTASQTISYGGTGMAVTAVSNAGFHFWKWSDGVTTAARTDDAANIEVTALFKSDDTTPPITTWPGWSATYVTKASIVLTATDIGGLGVDHTFWKFDGGDTTTGTVLSTGKAGLHTLEFWSVDKAGNPEEPHVIRTFTVLIATKLSITSDHTSVVHKHAVKLSGIITPNVYAGTHVEVWVLRPGSHAYTRLTTRSSYSYHHWSYTYYPATKGTWYFKVKLPQTSKYAKSESAYRRITVK